MDTFNLIFIIQFLCGLSATHDDAQCNELRKNVEFLMREVQELRETIKYMRASNDINDDKQKRYLVDGEINVEQEIVKLIQEVNDIKQGQGSVYTRWGRTECGGNSSRIYKGYTAGNWYGDTGGPANYVCLPEDPQWAKYLDGFQNIGNRIYGTEYEDNYESTFNPFDVHRDDEDAPCVVCRSPRATTIMIPARTSCYLGWELEYTGYTMTMSRAHPSASEYICVDGDSEAIAHGSQDDDGNMLFVVEAACGSLPCLPYVNGRELACVVCSK